jgi:predicted RNase H-like HicB family nuclease
MRYAVVIEKGATSYGAYVPDLPGCVAAATSREEVLRLITEAIEFHLEGMQEAGEPIPPPSSSVEFVDVAAKAKTPPPGDRRLIQGAHSSVA